MRPTRWIVECCRRVNSPRSSRNRSCRRRRIRPLRFTIKALLAIVLAVFLMPPVLTGFRQAADTIGTVNPALIAAGFVLQLLALACYSFLTRAALGTAAAGLSHARIFRIQLSTKALSNIVPGGNAAGSALGYRLLTLVRRVAAPMRGSRSPPPASDRRSC